jgi:hypothetical protein
MSIAPLIEGWVLLVVGVPSATTEVAEALENLDNQDLGSDSAEPTRKSIAKKAITGRVILDLVCISGNVLFLHKECNGIHMCKIYEFLTTNDPCSSPVGS